MKGTGAKRNVCPGSCVSTGAKFPVAPVESAPMVKIYDVTIFLRYDMTICILCIMGAWVVHELRRL